MVLLHFLRTLSHLNVPIVFSEKDKLQFFFTKQFDFDIFRKCLQGSSAASASSVSATARSENGARTTGPESFPAPRKSSPDTSSARAAVTFTPSRGSGSVLISTSPCRSNQETFQDCCLPFRCVTLLKCGQESTQQKFYFNMKDILFSKCTA